jgi:hypothetical protein
LATLIGSLIGLSVIGWQTRRGFKNLIASQEHRAEKEREARARDASNEQSEREKKALAAALAGELYSLWRQVRNTRAWHVVNTALLKEMERGVSGLKKGLWAYPPFTCRFMRRMSRN